MIKIYALIIFIKEYLLIKKDGVKNNTVNNITIFRVDCALVKLNCY